MPTGTVRLYLASTSPARLATLRAAGIEPILIPSGVDEDAAVRAAGPLTGPELVLLLARLKAEAVVGRLVDGEPIDGIILGGDSAFEFDGTIYGKPHEPAIARARWLAQRGHEGQLHSGHWLIDHRATAAVPGPVERLDGGQTSVPEPVEGPDGGQTSVPEPVEGPDSRAVGPSTGSGSGNGPGSGNGSGSGSGPGSGIGGVSTAAVRFADDISEAEVDAYVATGEPLEVAGAFTIDSLGGPFIAEVRGDPHAVVGLSLALTRTLLLEFGISWPQLWNRPL